MGASRDDFVKYPRTPHLFGSRGSDDDKHLPPNKTAELIADPSLIVEEKSTVAFARSPRNRSGSFFIVASKATSASLAPIVEH